MSADPWLDQYRERQRGRASERGRAVAATSHDPLMALGSRYRPTTPEPDDVRGWCAYWDAVANRGAGEPR